MTNINFRLTQTLVPLFLVCTSLLTTTLQAEEESSRVIAGLHSAQTLLDDLEYIVAEVAGRKESYEDNIFLNIDTFLIGVNVEESVRMDLIFSEEFGLEYQVIVPFSDLKEFLNDNLDPIDIVAERTRSDRDLYEITGNVYEGWMRVFKDPDYAVFFPRKEGIPKDMPHPAKLDDKLVEKGYGLFAHLKNDVENIDGRNKAFEKSRNKTVDALKKSTEESQNEFELRKKWLDLRLSIVQQWFAESTGFTAGSLLDKKEETLSGELDFAAIPDTGLAGTIERIHKEASYFAPIKPADDPALSIRTHLAFDEKLGSQFVEFYMLSNTVAHELIDEDSDLDDGQKAARKKVADLLNKVLVDSTEFGVVDSFLDINPSGDLHTFLMGIRCDGQEQIEQVFDELPKGQTGWKLEKDVDEVEGVKIHKVVIDTEIPESLTKMFGGPGGITYVAVSDKAFWVSFGANGLEELKASITAVRTAEDVKSTDVVLSINGHAQPLSVTLGDLINDEANLLGTLYTRRQKSTSTDEDDAGSEETGTGRQAASSFMAFEWITKVSDAMEGEDDRVSIELKYKEKETLAGTATAHKAILKAVGTMIANFADDNLQ